MSEFSRIAWVSLAIATLLASALPAHAQDHSGHSGHQMTMNEDGMVMNANVDTLPRDCESISRDYEFEVSAGVEYAKHVPGQIFAYDLNSFEVEPCSRIKIILNNQDEVRHQWMLHGLPRYLYPGGMFHLEASGGRTVSGSFIVPSDNQTYLVHCDITQHMEKGMKGQLKVGAGSGDLWAIPGVSSDFLRASYLPGNARFWSLSLLLLIPVLTFVVVLKQKH
jgi:FtsP/CotA-like multicopper oxidase with cupredoxin domain